MSIDYSLIDDRELVTGIINNDKSMIEYFFTKKCSKLLTYIMANVFDDNVDKRELLSELYIFFAKDNWQVFRNFQFRSTLMTYISVVSSRFFITKRAQLIDSPSSTTLNNKKERIHDSISAIDKRMDIRKALKRMPNDRYRKVLEMLYLRDASPDELSKEMDITIDNLYNIHRRALVQLRLVMGRKEDWV